MLPNWQIVRMGKSYFTEWREHRSLTQEQASEASGISVSVLSRIENGKRKFDENHLAALAKAYNCDTWELLGRNPLDEPAPVTSIWARILDKSKQAQALQVLETFTDKKKA
ncbi:MAG: helix-turn-helix transcriptional regulator [Maricaulis sp.]|jgi:transcriptional regulator with XRE-family HTH domain|nr:helix-turn-helix transcriptional regulator [Maricaulis sp.]